MRRINALVTVSVMVLFLVHLIWGMLILCGMIKGGSPIYSKTSVCLVILICVHAAISIKLTIDTLIAGKRSGVSYLKENRLFWIRRISGLAMAIFIALHVVIFTTDMSSGSPRLHLFDGAALATQVLLVVTLLLHLMTNITPMRIAFGLRDKGNLRTDALFVLAILLLLSGAAFVVYFVRWMVI